MQRYIMTVRKIPYEDRDVAHELDMNSYTSVHPGKIGQQVSYSVNLDAEQHEFIERRSPSNLVHMVAVGARGMGLADDSGEERDPDENLAYEIGDPQTPHAESIDTPPIMEATRNYRYWHPGPILDQGSEGACVGFSATAFLNCAPMMGERTNRDAFDHYRRAQQIDQWPGESYSGTSVRAGCDVMVEDGLIDDYAWARDKTSIYYWILNHGPVMLGMDWYEGMYVTDRHGFIRPTGRKVGGHALLARGRSAWNNLRLQNSWNTDFGDNGFCWLSEDDLDTMMATNSFQAATAVQVDE